MARSSRSARSTVSRADRRPLRRGQRGPALRAAHRRLRAVPHHAGRQHARRRSSSTAAASRRRDRTHDARTRWPPRRRRRGRTPGHHPSSRRCDVDARRRRVPRPVARPARRADERVRLRLGSVGRPAARRWPGCITQRLLPLRGTRLASCVAWFVLRCSLVTAVTAALTGGVRRGQRTGSRRRSSPSVPSLVGRARWSAPWCSSSCGAGSPLLHLNFFTDDMAGVGPEGPASTRAASLHAIVGIAHRGRHRGRDHPPARHRHRGLHDRGRRPVRRASCARSSRR